MTEAINLLVDIDGTLSDPTHRLHHILGDGPKNWDAFYKKVADDPPHEEIVSLLNNYLDRTTPERVIFLSGRRESTREETTKWLNRHIILSPPYNLILRKRGDFRPQLPYKEGNLQKLISGGFLPDVAFEDEPKVVALYRSFGIRVIDPGTWKDHYSME